MGAPEEQNEGSSHRKFGGGSEAINNRKRKRGARPNLFSSRMGIKGIAGGKSGRAIDLVADPRLFGDSGSGSAGDGVTESITLMNLLLIIKQLITQQRRRRRLT